MQFYLWREQLKLDPDLCSAIERQNGDHPFSFIHIFSYVSYMYIAKRNLFFFSPKDKSMGIDRIDARL